jgi:hypothetical protein
LQRFLQTSGEGGGFIIGSSSGREHGIPENAGWIDTIGVRAPFLPSHPSRAAAIRHDETLVKPVNACDFCYYCLDINFLHRVK